MIGILYFILRGQNTEIYYLLQRITIVKSRLCSFGKKFWFNPPETRDILIYKVQAI